MLAFEGAQGFGAQAKGGRGGEVVKVTNLNDSGVGSLRWALEDLDQKRIVVFEVGGQIDLKDQIEINGDVTLAGQTAPGGITVTGGRLRVVESDVIIRGMHVRPGDAADGDAGDNRDGIAVGKRGATVENVMVDSNSISWSVDELASTWGAPKNVTFSNNIMAEALQSSIHPKGDHSMGLLIGDGSTNVSVVGNLLASNEFRNATIKDDAKQVEFVNNVVHNYGPNGLLIHESSTANVVSNLYIPGADSAKRAAIRLESPEAGTAYYLSDNAAEVSGAATSMVQKGHVFSPRTTDVVSSDKLLEHVLGNVGARAGGLDSIDARIVEAVRKGNGKIIDSPDEVGGYEDGSLRRGARDSDDDGIPDAYETLIGSDPTRADAQDDADKDGYANIEDYINGLIDGFDTKPGNGGGEKAPAPVVQAPVERAPATEGTTEADTAPATALHLEAEEFDLSGFVADSLKNASGNTVIRRDGQGEHSAETSFEGEAGLYDIVVNYFDENDGESRLAVELNGEALDSWIWDADLGDRLANNNTQTRHVIEDVRLQKGDRLSLSGEDDGSEPLRIDSFDFLPNDLLAA